MERLEIFESDFEYGDWDVKDYSVSELNVTLSEVQLGVLWPANILYRGLSVMITYGLVYNSRPIFTFTGIKEFSFNEDYISLHFIAFLTESAIAEFHEEFMSRRKDSPVRYNKFFSRTVDELFDELAQVLDVIRLDGPPTA